MNLSGFVSHGHRSVRSTVDRSLIVLSHRANCQQGQRGWTHAMMPFVVQRDMGAGMRNARRGSM